MELILEGPDGEHAFDVALSTDVSLGGAPDDSISVPGLRRAAVWLRGMDAGIALRVRDPLKVGRAVCPRDVWRLLVPGEQAHLSPTHRLRLRDEASKRPPATAQLLKHMLAGEEPTTHRGAQLLCLTGLEMGRRFPLADGTLKMGRGMEAEVRLRDRSVSRLHAQLHARGGLHFVEDLNTANGVYLNGEKLQGQRRLQSGDIVEVGRTFLRYQAATSSQDIARPEEECRPDVSRDAPLRTNATGAPSSTSPGPSPPESRDASCASAMGTPIVRAMGGDWILIAAAILLGAGGLWLGLGTAFAGT
jgi:hypothetical protein